MVSILHDLTITVTDYFLRQPERNPKPYLRDLFYFYLNLVDIVLNIVWGMFYEVCILLNLSISYKLQRFSALFKSAKRRH